MGSGVHGCPLMVSTGATDGPEMAYELVRCGALVLVVATWCYWWAGVVVIYLVLLVGWCSLGMEKAHRLYRPMGSWLALCVWVALVARLLVLRWVDGGYRLSPIVYDGEPMP